MIRTRRRLVSALFVAVALAASGPVLSAQPGRGQTQPAPTAETAQSAREVRDQFMALLRRHPPGLGGVLKLDPALLANEAYLAPYPSLRTFLAQHPDIARNPAYYLEQVATSYGYSYRSESARMWEDIMTGVGIFVIVATMLGTFTWIVRTLIDYRRWHRLSKIQAETHAKLLDRFTANDELIAYVQSPAGSRFLQSAPIALDPGSRQVSAPFNRILWSVQAGVVLAAAGLGLYYVSNRVDPEIMQPLYTLGVFALFVGAGFVVSALVSYVLSKRMGLMDGGSPVAAGRGDLDA